MLRAGTAAGKQSWGLRHLGASPAQLIQEGLSRRVRDSAPDPPLGHLPNIYRINTRGDKPDRHNFSSLPTPPPSCFVFGNQLLLAAKPGGGEGGRGVLQEGPALHGTSRKTMWSAEAGNGLEASEGLSRENQGMGDGKGQSPPPSQGQGCL